MDEATFLDPATFSVIPGGQTTISFIPDASLGVNSVVNATTWSSTFSASMQSDAPGLASLFSLSVNISSATPGLVGVSFTSNPLLGLNNAAITAELLSGFAYDPATGDYSFNPTGQEIDASLTVPEGVSDITITDGMSVEDTSTAGAVPEQSSTLALLGLSTLSLLAFDLRWRIAKA